MDDAWDYEMEGYLSDHLEHELKRLAEGPAFEYLATNGDAIEARVQSCRQEAQHLLESGFPSSALIRAAAAIEIAIRFYLARPLLQGAFLSDQWAGLLSQKVLNGRTAEDRELLPAILRNWEVDITSVLLPNGDQLWESIVTRVWSRRNDCVHKGDSVAEEDATLAIRCLDELVGQVVDPLAIRLGFTRDVTGCWSTVAPKDPPGFEGLNHLKEYQRESPF